MNRTPATTRTAATTAAAADLSLLLSPVGSLIVAVLPVIAVWTIATTTTGLLCAAATIAALAATTPVTPLSLPAIDAQQARDAALPTMDNPWRALALVPHLLLACPNKAVRVVTAVNVAATATAVWMVANQQLLASLTDTTWIWTF